MGRTNWLRGSRCETRAERRLRKRHQLIMTILVIVLIVLTSAVVTLLVTRVNKIDIKVQIQRMEIYFLPETSNEHNEARKKEEDDDDDETPKDYGDIFEGEPILVVSVDEKTLKQLELPAYR